jgi:hypothetical protein
MEFYTLKQIAEKLGKDPSGVRKYIKNNCPHIEWKTQRDQNGQKCFVFSSEDVHSILATRELQGYRIDEDKQAKPITDEVGLFYIIQLHPVDMPEVIKLGFTSDLTSRVTNHKTCCPELKVIKVFPSKRYWEKTSIDYLAKSLGLKNKGGEVFLCNDLDTLINIADQFFSILNKD